MVSWTDTATWDDERKMAEYLLEAFVAKGLFEVRGRTEVLSLDNARSEILVRCDLEIYP